jgi:hypothetical protein
VSITGANLEQDACGAAGSASQTSHALDQCPLSQRREAEDELAWRGLALVEATRVAQGDAPAADARGDVGHVESRHDV